MGYNRFIGDKTNPCDRLIGKVVAMYNPLISFTLKSSILGFIFLCLTVSSSFAQNKDLATQTGNEFGLLLSNYRYTEPGVMNLKATKIGFEYSGTYAIDPQWPNQNKGWFVKTELRYLTGQADYDSASTGSISNAPDWYYEARILGGKDFHLDGYVLSPYLGLGYRHLYNDIRGTSTTGNQGYRRESNYYTVPIGVSHKLNLANQKQLQTTIEYSYLIRGVQHSKLSDSNSLLPDITNTQRSGYGLRLSTMMRVDKWAIGPSLIYWRINQSESSNGYVEPSNNTTEFGLKASYLF
jgi:hypothetical protein